MKKQSEIGFLLVYTPVYKELMSKPFELSYDQTIELEGFFISQISLRLDSERLRKLNQILQNLQIEPLTDGEIEVKNLGYSLITPQLPFFCNH